MCAIHEEIFSKKKKKKKYTHTHVSGTTKRKNEKTKSSNNLDCQRYHVSAPLVTRDCFRELHKSLTDLWRQSLALVHALHIGPQANKLVLAVSLYEDLFRG